MSRLALVACCSALALTAPGCRSFDPSPSAALSPAPAASGVGLPLAAGYIVVATRDMGRLETLDVIQGRDGSVSGLSNGKSKWVYGDTVLRRSGVDGSNWRDNTTSWTTDLDASNLITGFQQDTDSLGVPYEFLPHTQAELTFNQIHNDPGCEGDSCGYEFALWPGPVVGDPARNRTLYFFSRVYRGGSVFIGDGVGIDVQTADDPLVRPIVRPGAADPTIMFDADETPYAAATTVVGDMLYVYGTTLNFLDQDVSVARVPLADVLDRDAWRYYAGGGVWSPDIHAAVIIFAGHTIMSVAWNPYVSKYLAIYSKPLTNKIMLRAADRPEGPWSQEVKIIQGKSPGIANAVDYCGQAHTEFQGEGGRFEYVTYYRPTGFLQGETRVVQVEFGPRATGAPALTSR